MSGQVLRNGGRAVPLIARRAGGAAYRTWTALMWLATWPERRLQALRPAPVPLAATIEQWLTSRGYRATVVWARRFAVGEGYVVILGPGQALPLAQLGRLRRDVAALTGRPVAAGAVRSFVAISIGR